MTNLTTRRTAVAVLSGLLAVTAGSTAYAGPADPGTGHRLAPHANRSIPVTRTPATRVRTARIPERLTAAAVRAGITDTGGAYLGWHAAARIIPDRGLVTPTNPTPAPTDPTSPAPTPTPAPSPTTPPTGTTPGIAPGAAEGIDVSAYQSSINWSTHAQQGVVFAYLKATEGTYYKSPAYAAQLNGSTAQGLYAGAYHFANFRTAGGGAAQATYFVSNGGSWSSGTKRLPGVLDAEYDPYTSNSCWSKTNAQIATWILDFQDTYRAKTGIYPVIYTTTDWWKKCVSGDARAATIAARSPLWIARWASTPGTMPPWWSTFAIWQYVGTNLDRNRFNGTKTALASFAATGKR